jgi:methylthioribose-1-phosphate isomerase
MDFAAFGALRELHAMIRAEADRRGVRRDSHDGGGIDVKLGRGGIREVEFCAQLFQIVRGGRDPGLRDRRTRALRYKQLDADLPFAKTELDRSVTVPDQIRLVLQTFKEKLFTELFRIMKPGGDIVLSDPPPFRAVDLFHALHQGWNIIQGQSSKLARQQAALRFATQMEDDSRKACRQIGLHGLALLQHIAAAKQGQTINILTHCNAGYLACIAYGTATAPIYMAHAMGIPIHVFIDETRPRNQGARLTAFELGQHGIPHTIIADNAGGHLMQHSQVDIVITGADRCTRRGDAANKIGTYLKALAAADNQVPFYVALPSSTIDWQISDGVREIRIEQRDPNEVRCIDGWDGTQIREVLLCPPDSPAINYAFDVTPARLITGIITERGVCTASEAGLRQLFPEAPSA